MQRCGLGLLSPHRELCDPGQATSCGIVCSILLLSFLKLISIFSVGADVFSDLVYGILGNFNFQEFSRSEFPLYLVACVYLERLSQINVIFNASFSPFSFFSLVHVGSI